MDLLTNFEKIIKSHQTEEIDLDDIVGDILKISIQYTLVLLIILVLIINFYLAYFNKPA
jgi:hypothetical protein